MGGAGQEAALFLLGAGWAPLPLASPLKGMGAALEERALAPPPRQQDVTGVAKSGSALAGVSDTALLPGLTWTYACPCITALGDKSCHSFHFTDEDAELVGMEGGGGVLSRENSGPWQ